MRLDQSEATAWSQHEVPPTVNKFNILIDYTHTYIVHNINSTILHFKNSSIFFSDFVYKANAAIMKYNYFKINMLN